jgi:hypothetical protein
MESARKVVSVVVTRRAHVDDGRPLIGAEGIAFLESLRVDAFSFSGIDARAPMKRDVVRVIKMQDAREDDF